MTPRRFLATYATSALVLATAVIAANVVIDALGIVPGSPSVRGFNAEKVMRFGNDRLYKPLDLLGYRPRTVFLGTSRILEALDPAVLANTPYAPGYNYGLPGGDIDELEQHFERFISRTPSVETVFVELFLPRAVSRSGRTVEGIPELRAAALFSWSSLARSVGTVWMNWRTPPALESTPWVLPNGMQNFVGVSVASNFAAYPAALLRARVRYPVDASLLAPLRHMQRIAADRGIDLVYFISPMHAVQLYGLYRTGHWPAVEQWKRMLAREFAVIDFSDYAEVSDEPVLTDMRYWLDPHHFSRETARLVVEALIGLRSGKPKDFGVRLTAANVEERLREWGAARDAWIARNARWVSLFDRDGREAELVDGVAGGERCPLRISRVLTKSLGRAASGGKWQVSSYRTTDDPPLLVEVTAVARVPGSADGADACALKIISGPGRRSRRAVDWRIGHRIPILPALRGRTVRCTVEARATAAVSLGSGAVSVDDGTSVSRVTIESVTPRWRTITLEHAVSPAASVLEISIHLLERRGTIRPLGETLYFRPALDLVPDHRRTGTPEQGVAFPFPGAPPARSTQAG